MKAPQYGRKRKVSTALPKPVIDKALKKEKAPRGTKRVYRWGTMKPR